MSGSQYSSPNQDQMNQVPMTGNTKEEKKTGILDSLGLGNLFKPKDKTVKELQDEKAACSTIDSRLQDAEARERGTSNNMSQQGTSNMSQGGRKSRKQQGGRRRRTRMSGRQRSGKKRRGRKTRR